ncbi:MAG: hypothetical protein GX811_09160, partial [Lentisphaerae bacterium]|nr:hypothetical protein [Lentisphaerota bacterium]
FYNLVVTNQGVTLAFVPGSTSEILAAGTVTIKGSSESEKLKLLSSVTGEQWGLHVDPTATQDIWYVDVQDSDASPGSQVIGFFSQDSGNNKNWVFNNYPPGIVNEWTGAENNLWNNGANWHSGREPYPEDFILIPGGLTFYPTINAISRTLAGIEVEPGGSLNLGGYDLTVNGYAKFHGLLICESNEILTFHDNIDFSGGAFHRASSTLIIDGSSAQNFTPDGLEFYTIIIENPYTVNVNNGFSVYRLFVEPTLDETRSIVFRAGETVSVDFLSFISPAGTRAITLRSSNQNNSWNLSVNEAYTIRGVDVRDSNAQAGLNLIVSGSLNSGNNVNWDFDQSWAEWTGAAGDGLFGNANNWYPKSVPGATDMVRIVENKHVTISESVTIHSLIMGCGLQNAEMSANAKITVLNNLYLLPNSTLALNRPSEVDGNIVVFNGANLTHSPNTSVEINKLDLKIGGDIAILYDGSVNVTAKGHSVNQGPGGASNVSGGSYGGRGASHGGSVPGPCYGSVFAPTNIGSGGSYGAGGGAIRLEIAGQFILNGTMSAEAAVATHPSGSGGSIWLTFPSLYGNGVISADSIGGGGGRISLISTTTGYDFDEFSGTISAYGFRSGYGTGGGGTIYLENKSDDPGKGYLIVDGTPGAGNCTEFTANIPENIFYKVLVRKGANFAVGANHYIEVS